jgi:D-alanine-D-alanine ligase
VRIAVLKGGRSLERQVSLRSGARVEDALARLGHEVIGVDAGPDLVVQLREIAPDVAFVALHGRDGEDGTIQGLLDALGIPYTGSAAGTCMSCADKVLTKHALRARDLPTPDWFSVTEAAFKELGAADALPAIEEQLAFPLVVKPANQGSALGVRFAAEAQDIPAALVAAFSYAPAVLLERHVAGRELAVSVLDGEVLPIVEAIPTGDRYDFEARYQIGRTAFVCPADLSDEVTAAVQRIALDATTALGVRGVARVDLILDETDDGEPARPTILEVDTIPGLTETSLLPLAADAAGLDFDALVARMLASADRAGQPT